MRQHEVTIKKAIGRVQGVTEVRGQGLLLGIALEREDAPAVRDALANIGVLVNAPNARTIRIAPALTVTRTEIKRFISAFTEVMQEVYRG